MTWGWDLDHQSYEFSGWMWILRDIQSFHMESERDVFFWREISRCSFRGLIFRDFVLWNCGVVCSRFLQGRTMKSSNLYLSILLIFEEGPLCALKSLQKQQLFLMFFHVSHEFFLQSACRLVFVDVFWFPRVARWSRNADRKMRQFYSKVAYDSRYPNPNEMLHLGEKSETQ